MAKNRGNAGFTLVELMVGILCAAIVTAAAVTVMLLGMRINRTALDTASGQYDARIVLSVLEDMATEGAIKKAETTSDGWQLVGQSDQVLFSYSKSTETIYQGAYDEGKNGLIDGILSSSVMLNPSGLLSIRIGTDEGDYRSSVFCRTAIASDKTVNDLIDGSQSNDNMIDNLPVDEESTGMTNIERTGRYQFLDTLLSQYGSTGVIQDEVNRGKYYASWYAEKAELTNVDAWGGGTAWCACYVSWAADAISGYLSSEVPLYASVPTWLNSIINTSSWKLRGPSYDPIPGDLVFFDWDYDSTSSKLDPEHIGVVYYVEYDKDGDPATIYTIEGNSGNRVAVRQYPANSFYILGYGVLDWKTS